MNPLLALLVVMAFWMILAHGRGQGPDSHVVSPIRNVINKELGFHTLSLQMTDLAQYQLSGLFSDLP